MVGFLGNQALPPADAYTREESIEQIDKRLGFRNKVVNGDFESAQEGTSRTTLGYICDLWFANGSSTGLAGSVSRQTFALGQSEVPGNPQFFLRHDMTNTGESLELQHFVEGVITLSGGKAVVSFWLKGSVTGSIGIRLTQHFGTGGTPSDAVGLLIDNTVPITTSWQKITRTVDMPSISTKKLGTDGNDRVILTIQKKSIGAHQTAVGWASAIDYAGTLDVAEVQLEAGAKATPFERLEPGGQLRRCQRYLINSAAAPATLYSCYSGTGATAYYSGPEFSFPVSMRKVPALTVNFSDFFPAPSGGAIYATYARVRGLSVIFTSTAGTRGDVHRINISFTADARY